MFRVSSPPIGIISYAEWCSGSTGEFGSLSSGSNPGSAAKFIHHVNHIPLL